MFSRFTCCIHISQISFRLLNEISSFYRNNNESQTIIWRFERQKKQSQNPDTCKTYMSILMMRFHHQSRPYTLRYKGWFPKADQNLLKLLASRFIWYLKERISALNNKTDSFKLKLLISERVQW